MLSLLLLRPDREARYRALKAIASLNRSAEFKELVSLLESAQRHIDISSRSATAPLIFQNQGAAIFLEELLALFPIADKEARAILESQSASGAPSASAFP